MKFIDKYLSIKAATPHETGRLLTEHVQEVDNVLVQGILAKGVITGKIVDIQQHPHADRLRIASIDIGDDIIDIVTGAPNIEIGQIIPVAKVGAHVRAVDHHGDAKTVSTTELMEIKPVTLRGIESPGMVCGADELGLSNEVASGVYVFPAHTALGVPVESVIKTNAIIETDDKGTAHRPDLLSYKGIEQELAAILNQPSKRPFLPLPSVFGNLDVSIQATTACSLFLAAKIDQFNTFESPLWLQDFLTDHDIKVINLPTDVTNYVMLTEGGSTHAFGAENIDGNALTIRFAHDNEVIEALNNKEYQLTPTDLVIADEKKSLDIAGIIGGKHTSVTSNTKSIILTSNVIDAAVVRRTSRKLGIRTDASVRRERGQSAASSINAFVTIINLLHSIAGAQVTSLHYTGDVTAHPQAIDMDLVRMNSILHLSFTNAEVIDLLKRLHYSVDKESDKLLTITPPWWRSDIHFEADVYEDIARIYGFGKIDSHVRIMKNSAIESKDASLVQLIRHAAAELMYEVQTSSMVSKNTSGAIEIQNPIGHKKYIRQTLLPELFVLAEQYTREGYDNYACFEIGKTYRKENGQLTEKYRFGACIVGDIEQSKSLIAHVLHRIHIQINDVAFVPCDQSEERAVKYDAVAKIFFKDKLLGNMCVKEIRGKTYCGFKLYIEALTEIANQKPQFHDYSKFPPVKRDLAFIVNKDTLLGTIAKTIKDQSVLIDNVQLFDRFSDKSMQPNEHSLAFHLTFQSSERTLTDTEVNDIMHKIEQELQNKFNANVRK